MFSVTCAVSLYLSVLPTRSKCAWCCFSALGWAGTTPGCLLGQAGRTECQWGDDEFGIEVEGSQHQRIWSTGTWSPLTENSWEEKGWQRTDNLIRDNGDSDPPADMCSSLQSKLLPACQHNVKLSKKMLLFKDELTTVISDIYYLLLSGRKLLPMSCSIILQKSGEIQNWILTQCSHYFAYLISLNMQLTGYLVVVD